jgi:hypothetical protein
MNVDASSFIHPKIDYQLHNAPLSMATWNVLKESKKDLSPIQKVNVARRYKLRNKDD